MREFIEALFEKENKIEFQYEDYEMSFFNHVNFAENVEL